MIGFVLFGIIFGITVSSAIREFRSRELVGFSILGIGGSLYGNFVASMINGYLPEPNLFLTPTLIVSMAGLLTGIKVLLLKRQKITTTEEQ